MLSLSKHLGFSATTELGYVVKRWAGTQEFRPSPYHTTANTTSEISAIA